MISATRRICRFKAMGSNPRLRRTKRGGPEIADARRDAGNDDHIVLEPVRALEESIQRAMTKCSLPAAANVEDHRFDRDLAPLETGHVGAEFRQSKIPMG